MEGVRSRPGRGFTVHFRQGFKNYLNILKYKSKFDTSIELLKRKNKIGGDGDLWLGRTIMVPDDASSLLSHSDVEAEKVERKF